MNNNTFEVIPAAAREKSTGYLLNTIDTINTTNIYRELLESGKYNDFKNNFADLITTMVLRREEDKFHNSLNIFQKAGFISDRKLQEHHARLGLVGGIANFSLTALPDLTILLFNEWKMSCKINEMLNFLVASLGYINRETNSIILSRIDQMYKLLGRKYKHTAIVTQFADYADSDLSKIPQFKKNNFSTAYRFYYYVLAVSDLQEKGCRQRAAEIGDLLGFSAADIDYIENNVMTNQQVISDISQFSSINIKEILGIINKNFEHTDQYIKFTIENDPHKKRQQETMSMVKKILAAGTLTTVAYFGKKHPESIVAFAKPYLEILINPENNLQKTIDIKKYLKNIRN
ncbi:MAG: hypothetical protein PHR06_10060 [Candidatus Cloacimonetes bacterium]|nr:hypothetical protein [Candidatus Cloacimonadota bacterium]